MRNYTKNAARRELINMLIKIILTLLPKYKNTKKKKVKYMPFYMKWYVIIP